MFRTADNHASAHAIGTVVLLLAGLEAWLNDGIALFGFHDAALKPLAFEAAGRKYYVLPQRVSGRPVPVSVELDLVLELRNEIAHYLPRPLMGEGNVPQWFLELHRRGLFLTTGNPSCDFVFGQKLGAYRLAYWAWQTVDQAISGLMEALGDDAVMLRGTASNFARYKGICAPCDLGGFDARCGLKITGIPGKGPHEAG